MTVAAGKNCWKIRKLQLAIAVLYGSSVFLSELTARPILSLFNHSQGIPQQEEPHRELAKSIVRLHALVDQKRWEEAQQLARKLLEPYPDNPELFYLNGVTLFQLTDSIGAVRSFRRAETLGFNALSLHKSLGIAYYSLQQYKLFRAQMEKALAMDQHDYETNYYLGRYYESVVNNFPLALRYFERSIKSKPSFEKSVYYRGYCYEMLGQRTEALENYETAVQLVEKSAASFSWPHQSLGRLLMDSQPEKAFTLALRAVAIEPELESNHLLLAKMYERKNDLNQSLAELRKAVQLNPTSTATRYLIFRLLNRLGKREEAKNELLILQKLKSTYGDQ